MFKKVSLVFFSALWFCSIFLFVYRIVEPDTAIDRATDVVSVTIPDSPVQMLTSNTDTNQIKYYYFCTVDHQDCMYMNNTLFKNLANEMKIESFDFFEFVDVEDLYEDWTPAKLKSVWGFESYPALVAAKGSADAPEILNVLEWTETTPLDESSIKNWMILNELWDGPADQTGELIDKPIGE